MAAACRSPSKRSRRGAWDSIALPVLGVTFCFRGLDELARDDFLAYFDLYTRRGGG